MQAQAGRQAGRQANSQRLVRKCSASLIEASVEDDPNPVQQKRQKCIKLYITTKTCVKQDSVKLPVSPNLCILFILREHRCFHCCFYSCCWHRATTWGVDAAPCPPCILAGLPNKNQQQRTTNDCHRGRTAPHDLRPRNCRVPNEGVACPESR